MSAAESDSALLFDPTKWPFGYQDSVDIKTGRVPIVQLAVYILRALVVHPSVM